MNHGREESPGMQPGALYADRYRIISLIGRGGMGKVYLAEDTRLNGKRRALKLTVAAVNEKDAFIREARLLSELQHPHLPGIVDYYPPDANGWAAIVMEYVPGDTLADLFARSGNRLPFDRVLRYLCDLCRLLCYLHGRSTPVVFRDLKPANVLVDRHDRAVLVDFGIARTYRPEAAADTERLGTPAFAAPEQLRGGQTDARTDLFGFGALAYHLLSGGRFAYQRTGSVLGMMQGDVPVWFGELLERLLSDDPLQRPQSAADLLRMLDATAVTERGGESAGIAGRHGRIPNDGVAVAAILSAYPGAGATLAALGLSRYLSDRDISHALVECPGGDPELYGLLNGSRFMPKHAVFAHPGGQEDPVPAWRSGSACYYPLAPGRPAMQPDASFAVWIRQLGVPVVLLDVSCKWEHPGMAEWLIGANVQSVWWLADNLPAKWSTRRQTAAADLQNAALNNGIPVGWIANRDHAFSERAEWLSCFPQPPAVKLPLLPSEAVIRAVWRGDGYPSGKKFASASDRAFQTWAKAVIESQGR